MQAIEIESGTFEAAAHFEQLGRRQLRRQARSRERLRRAARRLRNLGRRGRDGGQTLRHRNRHVLVKIACEAVVFFEQRAQVLLAYTQ